jgi:hypothetical protein
MNMHKTEVSITDLMTTLVGFSFTGDIRMQYKMENPDKIANIVKGNLAGLSDLYIDLLLEMQEDREDRPGILKFRDDGSL